MQICLSVMQRRSALRLRSFSTSWQRPMQLRWISNVDIPFTTVLRTGRQAAKAVGSGSFGCFFLGDAYKLQDAMISAHHRARIAIKSGPGDFPVGVNVSVQDEQAVGPNSKRDKKCAEVYDPWLAAAAQSDFLGVQTYTRCRVSSCGAATRGSSPRSPTE